MMQTARKIKVFYATDRDQCGAEYTNKPGEKLHYGLQKVSIPPFHQRGKVESPIHGHRGNRSEHFMLVGIKSMSERDFLGEIRTEREKGDQREVLLYIHGFNVNFKDALKIAAQLKYDLGFRGLVILYSWPTREGMLSYFQDSSMIMGSAKFLREFIKTVLREEVAFSKVHILAHSMGNRALIEALTDPQWNPLSEKEPSQRRGVLTNVILAAADEELDKFQEMLHQMDKQNLVPRPIISVYSSACDWALFGSKVINWRSRLGDTRSLLRDHLMRKGDSMVDVIDASGVRYDGRLQHSYYAEAHAVLDDIQNLLRNDHRARNRAQNPRIHQVTHFYNGHPDWDFYAFEPRLWDYLMEL